MDRLSNFSVYTIGSGSGDEYVTWHSDLLTAKDDALNVHVGDRVNHVLIVVN